MPCLKRTMSLLIFLMIVPFPVQGKESPSEVVARILKETPLIDGHNDLPWQCRKRFKNHISKVPLGEGTQNLSPPMHTDLPRLAQGKLGGQFWSVYVPTSLDGASAVQATLEQVDVVRRLIEMHPDTFGLAHTAEEIRTIHAEGKIASLIGMEGGHSIGNSLAVLRQMFELGARYMTITHSTHTDWADSATADPLHGGLTEFGEEVIREMNRLGMIVDLSHVSHATMHDALDVTRAPVIFSHSGVDGAHVHPRNVPDSVLKRVKENGGVVMVIFLPGYLADGPHRWWANRKAQQAFLESYYRGQPERIADEMKEWDVNNPRPATNLDDVIRHVDYIRDTIGIDHVGIGSDYDGMGSAPEQLEDVAGYPALFEELLKRGYSESDLAKIAGENVLRVMEAVETYAQEEKGKRGPSEILFTPADE